jgi:hypothetical protein
MPDQNLPIPDFADDGVLLAVEPPAASRGRSACSPAPTWSVFGSP